MNRILYTKGEESIDESGVFNTGERRGVDLFDKVRMK